MFSKLINDKHRGYFITGTDTEVGKTYVSVQLLDYFNQHGYSTLGIKPVASGSIQTNNGKKSEDALFLHEVSSVKIPYEKINPVLFDPFIAPNIAAQEKKYNLTVDTLYKQCQTAITTNVDKIIIEGAGGWLCPLNYQETLADFAKRINFPIILVIGIRLGCLNHALLTWEHLKNMNMNVCGWIANCIEENEKENEIIETLENMITAPKIATIPNHY